MTDNHVRSRECLVTNDIKHRNGMVQNEKIKCIDERLISVSLDRRIDVDRDCSRLSESYSMAVAEI